MSFWGGRSILVRTLMTLEMQEWERRGGKEEKPAAPPPKKDARADEASRDQEDQG